jgi:hypothetical protein
MGMKIDGQNQSKKTLSNHSRFNKNNDLSLQNLVLEPYLRTRSIHVWSRLLYIEIRNAEDNYYSISRKIKGRLSKLFVCKYITNNRSYLQIQLHFENNGSERVSMFWSRLDTFRELFIRVIIGPNLELRLDASESCISNAFIYSQNYAQRMSVW